MRSLQEPTLAVVNGVLRTMDPSSPTAEAVLVRGERIIAVGSTAEVRALAPAGTREIDAGGHTVLPGLDDAHLHFLGLGLSLQRLLLADARSLAEVQQRVRAAAMAADGQGWVLGRSWNHNVWPRPVMPTRHDLDAVAPGAPVALTSKDGHAIWCNSAALRLAGVDASTPAPAGGRIVREPDGSPSGVLCDEAIALIQRVIPPPDAVALERAARAACQAALSLGVTSVQSCEGPDEYRALSTLERAGDLGVRVWHMVPVECLCEALHMGLQTGQGSDRLRIGHVKMFADGALGSATAEMLAPYEGDPDNFGVAVADSEALYEAALAAARSGLASAIHAIGDRANRRVLDVYERLAQAAPQVRLRQRIEHVQLITPEDVGRLARLGVVASMQPIHCIHDMHMADRQWGARSCDAYVFRSILDAGVPLAFGTDCPVEPLAPLPGVYAAVTRQEIDGTPTGGWHPAQRLTLHEALYAYTMGAAYASYQEQRKGSITPGKWADLIILSDDIFAADTGALLRACVDVTIVSGQVAFGA